MNFSSVQNYPQHNIRFQHGLIRSKVGSFHMIKDEEGKLHQIMIQDKARFSKTPTVIYCSHCREAWKTYPECVVAHDQKQLAQEVHVYFWKGKLKLEDGSETIILLSTDET